MKKLFRKILISTDVTCYAAYTAGFISLIIYIITKTDLLEKLA